MAPARADTSSGGEGARDAAGQPGTRILLGTRGFAVILFVYFCIAMFRGGGNCNFIFEGARVLKRIQGLYHETPL